MTNIYRAWINQPSAMQIHHALHGKTVIVADDGAHMVRVYFTEGETHSMVMPQLCVSRVHISAAEDV